jgi:nitrite reductase/ring-hydroxylating ferredoxin subunit
MIAPLERLAATPPGVRLCRLGDVSEGRARGLVLETRTGRFHGFVVRRGADIYGYADQCPHAGLPLAQTLDAYLTPQGDLIACNWHGALFRIEGGMCVAGPCMGRSLTRWPVGVDGEWIVTK